MRDGPRCIGSRVPRRVRPGLAPAAGSRWAATTWDSPRLTWGGQVRPAPAWRIRPPTLTTVSHLLELPGCRRRRRGRRRPAASSTSVLVVEPGTPRGMPPVLAARDRALAAGWRIVALSARRPFVHDDNDWCYCRGALTRSSRNAG